MFDYSEPTQEGFDNVQSIVTDVMETRCPSLITKMGSVIHELIIRPMSYLLAWVVHNTDEYREKSSVAYLKTSTETDNPIADAVASNYFLTRNHGTKSKGLVSFTVTAPYTTVSRGSALTVGGVPVLVSQKCVLTSSALETQSEGVLYIKMIPEDDHWLANVPVETVEIGNIEVPAGSSVIMNFTNRLGSDISPDS